MLRERQGGPQRDRHHHRWRFALDGARAGERCAEPADLHHHLSHGDALLGGGCLRRDPRAGRQGAQRWLPSAPRDDRRRRQLVAGDPAAPRWPGSLPSLRPPPEGHPARGRRRRSGGSARWRASCGIEPTLEAGGPPRRRRAPMPLRPEPWARWRRARSHRSLSTSALLLLLLLLLVVVVATSVSVTTARSTATGARRPVVPGRAAAGAAPSLALTRHLTALATACPSSADCVALAARPPGMLHRGPSAGVALVSHDGGGSWTLRQPGPAG